MMLYHTGLFATDAPNEAASTTCGTASYVIDGGLLRGSPEEIRQTISRLQEERLGTFGSSYESSDCIRVHSEVRIRSETLEQAYAAAHTLTAALAVSDGNSWLLPDGDIDLIESGEVAPFLLVDRCSARCAWRLRCRQMGRYITLSIDWPLATARRPYTMLIWIPSSRLGVFRNRWIHMSMCTWRTPFR
jgi:hypothetical protein